MVGAFECWIMALFDCLSREKKMKRNNGSPYRSRGMTLGSRGMTLLEVLVALAIFATAAISVIRAVTQHINTLSYLEEEPSQLSHVLCVDTGRSSETTKAHRG
eukprot:TRINITY_DN14098_c0_g1_i1.p1 TRINITY_DN14098_c0_g1~~TRINITY_DN14098_c0_g1_i1.p1  ORF type:complete len:103 (+),score=39.72 TRINITY_DN14098_c0_g1_i1:148-456(+)